MKKLKIFLTHPVVSGSAVLVVGSMFVNFVNFIYHFVMGKILTPSDYGILLSLYSILYILSIVPLSSSVSIVKFISSSEEPERSLVYFSIKKFIFKLALFLSILVVVLSPLIAGFLNIKDVVSVVITALVLFFSLVTLVNQASLQGILNFLGAITPNLVSGSVKLVLGILFIFLGLSVRGAMLAVVFGVLGAYLLSVYFIKGKFKENFAKKYNLVPFLKYGLPVLIQAFAFTSFFTTDVLLVKHFFPDFEAGLYGSLSTLGKIIFFAASPVASAMFPFVAKRKSKGEKYFKVFLGAVGLTVLISIPILGGYYLVPGLTISLLYTREYLGAQQYLFWMGMFMVFYTLNSLLVNFFLSIDKAKIVVLPLIFAILQGLGIWFYHDSLLQVIQISLSLSIFLFMTLGTYLLYNRLKS